MSIGADEDLHGAAIIELLQDHLREMHSISPPESVHALNLDGLRRPGMTFWSVWIGHDFAGRSRCG